MIFGISWHYLPVLVKKLGALRNGAPFKDRDLPPALAQVCAKLNSHTDSDRQFVKVAGAVLNHGLAVVRLKKEDAPGLIATRNYETASASFDLAT
jgi:hypothetical protein